MRFARTRAVTKSLLVGLLVVLMLAAPASAAKPAGAVASVDVCTPDPVGLVGGNIKANVRIGHVGYLTGYQFTLHFDPDVLQAEDSVPAQAGVQIGHGDVFEGRNFSIVQTVDNGTGEIVFSNFLVGPGNFVTITAPNTALLAQVTFRIVGPGNSQLMFDSTPGVNAVSGRDLLPIESEWTDGSVQGVVPREKLYIPLVASDWR